VQGNLSKGYLETAVRNDSICKKGLCVNPALVVTIPIYLRNLSYFTYYVKKRKDRYDILLHS